MPKAAALLKLHNEAGGKRGEWANGHDAYVHIYRRSCRASLIGHRVCRLAVIVSEGDGIKPVRSDWLRIGAFAPYLIIQGPNILVRNDKGYANGCWQQLEGDCGSCIGAKGRVCLSCSMPTTATRLRSEVMVVVTRKSGIKWKVGLSSPP